MLSLIHIDKKEITSEILIKKIPLKIFSPFKSFRKSYRPNKGRPSFFHIGKLFLSLKIFYDDTQNLAGDSFLF